jgi:hypothetical protein
MLTTSETSVSLCQVESYSLEGGIRFVAHSSSATSRRASLARETPDSALAGGIP